MHIRFYRDTSVNDQLGYALQTRKVSIVLYTVFGYMTYSRISLYSSLETTLAMRLTTITNALDYVRHLSVA